MPQRPKAENFNSTVPLLFKKSVLEIFALAGFGERHQLVHLSINMTKPLPALRGAFFAMVDANR